MAVDGTLTSNVAVMVVAVNPGGKMATESFG